MEHVRKFLGMHADAPPMSDAQQAVADRQKRIAERQRAIDIQVEVLAADRRDVRRR